MHRVIGVAACLAIATVAGCKKDQLEGAKAEVQKTSIKLDLPAVPDFVMPQPNADGTHSVAEMRLRGNKFLDTEVKVKGYVVWIYDCATANRTPGTTCRWSSISSRRSPAAPYAPGLVLRGPGAVARAAEHRADPG